MASLFAALALFVAFHFLPSVGYQHQEKGWKVWLRLCGDVWKPTSLDGQDALIIAVFLNFSLVIVVTPFLKDVLSRSRLAWWGAVVFSGLPGVLFCALFLVFGKFEKLGLGNWCLMLALVLNLLGLLLAGSPTPKSGETKIVEADLNRSAKD